MSLGSFWYGRAVQWLIVINLYPTCNSQWIDCKAKRHKYSKKPFGYPKAISENFRIGNTFFRYPKTFCWYERDIRNKASNCHSRVLVLIPEIDYWLIDRLDHHKYHFADNQKLLIGDNNRRKLGRLPTEVGNCSTPIQLCLIPFGYEKLAMQYVRMSEMQNLSDIWSQYFGYNFRILFRKYENAFRICYDASPNPINCSYMDFSNFDIEN